PRAASSFDHLVGALLENPRHVETERLGGFEVYHYLELDRSLDRKLARLRALEDAIGVNGGAPKIIGYIGAVGGQTADFGGEPPRSNNRNAIVSRQRSDLGMTGDHESIRHHDEATVRLARLRSHDCLQSGRVTNR